MADLKFLWRSPYMNDRWKTVIKSMVVTNRPVHYIKPWAKTAITCFSPLAIMVLSRTDTYAGLYQVPREEALTVHAGGQALIFDCPLDMVGKLRRTLANKLAGVVLRFAPPERSPGLSDVKPRILVRVCLPSGLLTEAEAIGLFGQIRRIPSMQDPCTLR